MIHAIATEAHHRAHLAPIAALLPTATRRRQPGDVALVASYGDLRRARRLQYDRIVLAQHGAGQSYGGDHRSHDHPSYPGGRDNAEAGLFLVPNDFSADRWRQAYPRTPVAIVGSPRLDALPLRGSMPGPTVAVSFHWNGLSCPEAGNAIDTYGPALAALSKAFHVIGHGHPKLNAVAQFWRKRGIEYVRSFDEVCRRADVYVCDNSSTLFEFAATGRPVVVLNSPRYRRNVSHGLRFWDAAHVGVNVDRSAQLIGSVEEAIADRPEQQRDREDALSIVYAYRTGAAERAAEAIREWAGIGQPVAA